jgi:hypothetical protein
MVNKSKNTPDQAAIQREALMGATWAVGDRDTHYQAALRAAPKPVAQEYYANGALVLDPDDFALYTLEKSASPCKFRLYPVIPTNWSGMDQGVIEDFPGHGLYERFVFVGHLGTPVGASILQHYAKRDLEFFKGIKEVIAHKARVETRDRLIEAKSKLSRLNPQLVSVGTLWTHCHGGYYSVISVYGTSTVKLMRVDTKKQFESEGGVIQEVPMVEFLETYGYVQDGLLLP